MSRYTRGPYLANDLARLCDDVLRRDQHKIAAFAEDYDDAGARTFACLLYALHRADGALYWWGFAAGAGDELAAHCLAVHHAATGRQTDARLWRTFARMLGFDPDQHLPEPARTPTEPVRTAASTVQNNTKLGQFLTDESGLPRELVLG